MVRRERSLRAGDGGAVLVLTLILVVVMSVIVVGLLQFVTVGFTTSDVASERTETNADSSNVMHWAIEEFAKKQLRPEDPSQCGEVPTYVSIPVPPDLVSNGSVTTLECAQTNPINGEPVVHLIAQSTGDQTRVVEATVETPRFSHGARVADWRVDIPINVPVYTTTTTIAPTTTTSTAPSNSPPFAADMTVSIVLDAAPPPFSFTLPATDPDGDPMTIVSLNTGGDPINVNNLGVINVDVAATTLGGASAPMTYTFDYVVEDDSGADSNTGTVTVNVTNSGPPSTSTTTSTTSTTLAPNPACTFLVTSASGGGASGIGQLTVTNSGGDFTGWQVRIDQINAAKPWQFTWGPGVTASASPASVFVSGAQTITTTTPFSVTASLVQAANNPKIVAGNTLACTVLSP